MLFLILANLGEKLKFFNDWNVSTDVNEKNQLLLQLQDAGAKKKNEIRNQVGET